jgi:hypothetical protein
MIKDGEGEGEGKLKEEGSQGSGWSSVILRMPEDRFKNGIMCICIMIIKMITRF